MKDLDQKIIELMDLFDDEQVTTVDKIDRPERAIEKQAIDDFMKRNPQADGGRIGFSNGPPKEMVDELNRIKLKTEPLKLNEKQKLFKSYDNLFKQEYKRLLSIGDPFSKIDLNRAVINRIAKENPTINLQEGIGLDKIPGGGNEESKTLFERYDKTSSRGPIFNKKELKNFTQGNAVKATSYTKTQENIFKELLKGNNDLSSLTKTLGISEGRLSYNMEKLMRNLAKGSGDQYTFLKQYKEKDLETARNNVYESPTLENAYQRTIIQSVLQSTKLGSSERKQAFNKLKEFNKFKKVMTDNGLDPKILALDHAASYRAIKNGNIKTFLSVTPVIRDINTLKSTFDKRSQQNLRRMQEYLKSGDNKNYKFFLKNQTELENLWSTMTGGQSSLGKIRVTASGPKKGTIRIYNYGATSLLDKNKNLLNELDANLAIRQNIVNASSVENLNEARRIMLEGSTLTEKKMLGTFKPTDRAPRTKIDQAFKDLNKPEMFKTEKQIKGLIPFMKNLGIKCQLSNGINCSNPQAYEKSLNELSEKAAQGDQAAKTTLSKFGNKVATAGRFLKGALGPLAIATEVALEGGIALNKTLNEGVPIKQAFADSLTNKYLLGPKLQIDKEAEIAKEFEKGEEFAMAKRGERMFLPQSATADAQRLKKREEEMKALYPDLQFANPGKQEIDMMLADKEIYSPFTLGFGMQQRQPGIGDMRYNEDLAYDQIRDIINKNIDDRIQSQQMQNIADAGGVANLAGGGIAGLSGGVDEGPQRRSLNPDSQGLQGLMKRVKKL